MILEAILNLVKILLQFVFALLPDIPNFDVELLSSLTDYINLIFDNLGLLGFFFPISTFKIIIPLLIVVINFEHIYHFALWILKKIPILDVK